MVKKIRFQPLEPCILLDAAGAVTAAETTQDQQQEMQKMLKEAVAKTQRPELQDRSSESENSPLAPFHLEGREATAVLLGEIETTALVVVDTSIDGHEQLLAELEPGTEILLIDGDENGIEKLAEYVEGRDDISSIHILSHGAEGEFSLGTTVINSENVDQYADFLSRIGDSLTEDGDLLLYGCNVAENGVGIEFVTKVAEYTDADVAGSDDLTGAAELGGDWDLETTIGQLDTESLTFETFADVLNQDPDPPELLSAITPPDGTYLLLSFADINDLASSGTLAASDFTVTVNGTTNDVTAVTLDAAAKTIRLDLTTAATLGDQISVSFTQAAGGDIRDSDDNVFGNFSDFKGAVSPFGAASSEWTPIVPSGTTVYDYLVDQQTGQDGGDLVGAEGESSFSIYFDDAGSDSATDGYLSLRWRVGDIGNSYYYAGIDANLDGDLDVFLVVNSNGTISIWGNDPSALNISPSTTGLDSTAFGGDFDYDGNLTQTVKSNVTSIDAGYTFDLDGVGDEDYYVQLTIPFAQLVAALDRLSIAVDDTSAIRWVAATATQGNSFNQDIAGLEGSNSADITYAASGTFSNPVDPCGTPVTPTGVPQINDLQGDSAEFQMGGNPVVIDQDAAANVTDSDDSDFEDPNSALDGGIRIFIEGGDPTEDTLWFDTSGSVLIETATQGQDTIYYVLVDGVRVGTVTNTAFADPLATQTLLTVTFDQAVDGVSAATLANVNTILQSVTHENTTGNSLDDRSVFFYVSDGSLSDEVSTTVTLQPTQRPTVNTLDTNNNQPTLTGSYDTNLYGALTVELDGTVYTVGDGHLTLDGNPDPVTGIDTWTLDLFTQPITPLVDGIYEVTATVTDTNGNVLTDVSTSELLVDTAAPLQPTVVDLATGDTTPVIVGTFQSAETEVLTVTLYWDDDNDPNTPDVIYLGPYVLGTDPELTSSGDNWTLNLGGLGAELPEEASRVIVTAEDAVGNSATDDGSLIVIDSTVEDTTPPITPTVNSQTTNNPTPTITGSYDHLDFDLDVEGALTVEVGGTTYTYGTDAQLDIDGTGGWTLTPTVALADGDYDVTVTITDPSGNASLDATTNELTVDTQSPVPVPTVNTLFTRTVSPTITGTYDDTDAAGGLSVSVNGNTYALGDDPELTVAGPVWSLNLIGADALTVDTSYDVSVVVSDAAGNTSTDTSTNEVTIVSAAAPTVTFQTTANVNPSVEGEAPFPLGGGEQLDVTIRDSVGTVVATFTDVTINADGSWFVLLNDAAITNGSSLADGVYNVDAVITKNGVGVTGGTDLTSGELTVDTTAPVIPPSVDTLTTSDATPTLTGQVVLAEGESLSVTVNGATYDNVLLGPAGTEATPASWTLDTGVTPSSGTLGTFSDGPYEVLATITDGVGNTITDTSTYELTIDLTPPSAPTVTPVISTDGAVTLAGTFDQSDAAGGFEVTVNGNTYTLGAPGSPLTLGTMTDTWTLDLTGVTTPDGTYEVTAVATDNVGLATTDVSTFELIVDTTPPTQPTVVSQITPDTTPTITGTFDAAGSADLVVTVNMIEYRLSDGTNLTAVGNNWSLTIPGANPLGPTTYNVTASAEDQYGNAIDDATSGELIIDLGATADPSVNPLVTNNQTPTITGTADVDLSNSQELRVTVNGVTYVDGDGNLEYDDTSNTWSLTIPSGNELGSASTSTTYDVAAEIFVGATKISDDNTVGDGC